MPPKGTKGWVYKKRAARATASAAAAKPPIAKRKPRRIVEEEPPPLVDANEDSDREEPDAEMPDDADSSNTPPSDDEDEDEEPVIKPTLEISMTVSRLKHHVVMAWANAIHRWMKAKCLAGCVSLEKGGRHENLHCQIIMRLKWDPNDLDSLKKEIKVALNVRRGDCSFEEKLRHAQEIALS